MNDSYSFGSTIKELKLFWQGAKLKKYHLVNMTYQNFKFWNVTKIH
jgi:hypothetical protein